MSEPHDGDDQVSNLGPGKAFVSFTAVISLTRITRLIYPPDRVYFLPVPTLALAIPRTFLVLFFLSFFCFLLTLALASMTPCKERMCKMFETIKVHNGTYEMAPAYYHFLPLLKWRSIWPKGFIITWLYCNANVLLSLPGGPVCTWARTSWRSPWCRRWGRSQSTCRRRTGSWSRMWSNDQQCKSTSLPASHAPWNL